MEREADNKKARRGGRVNKNGESPAGQGTDALCQMCVAISRLPGSGAQNGIAHRGTGRGTWTHGTRFWRPLLYQLSYARVKQKPQGGFPFLTAFDGTSIPYIFGFLVQIGIPIFEFFVSNLKLFEIHF